MLETNPTDMWGLNKHLLLDAYLLLNLHMLLLLLWLFLWCLLQPVCPGHTWVDLLPPPPHPHTPHPTTIHL